MLAKHQGTSDKMGTVQMSIRLEEKLRDDLKIHAIQEKIKINDLLVRYIQEGLDRERK
jgi:predicted HicB family RNase H-like nuclease